MTAHEALGASPGSWKPGTVTLRDKLCPGGSSAGTRSPLVLRVAALLDSSARCGQGLVSICCYCQGRPPPLPRPLPSTGLGSQRALDPDIPRTAWAPKALCVHVGVCDHVHVCPIVHMYLCACMYKRTCMFVCMYVHVRACPCACKFMCARMSVCACVFMCVHACVSMC